MALIRFARSACPYHVSLTPEDFKPHIISQISITVNLSVGLAKVQAISFADNLSVGLFMVRSALFLISVLDGSS